MHAWSASARRTQESIIYIYEYIPCLARRYTASSIWNWRASVNKLKRNTIDRTCPINTTCICVYRYRYTVTAVVVIVRYYTCRSSNSCTRRRLWKAALKKKKKVVSISPKVPAHSKMKSWPGQDPPGGHEFGGPLYTAAVLAQQSRALSTSSIIELYNNTATWRLSLKKYNARRQHHDQPHKINSQSKGRIYGLSVTHLIINRACREARQLCPTPGPFVSAYFLQLVLSYIGTPCTSVSSLLHHTIVLPSSIQYNIPGTGTVNFRSTSRALMNILLDSFL